MSGNLWEWCQDWYGANYYSEEEPKGIILDPKGPDIGNIIEFENEPARVLRGGSWLNDVWDSRVSIRGRSNPWNRHSSSGFRFSQD